MPISIDSDSGDNFAGGGGSGGDLVLRGDDGAVHRRRPGPHRHEATDRLERLARSDPTGFVRAKAGGRAAGEPYGSVTAPRSAPVTMRAYLASTPVR
jgi:hypothetical protein